MKIVNKILKTDFNEIQLYTGWWLSSIRGFIEIVEFCSLFGANLMTHIARPVDPEFDFSWIVDKYCQEVSYWECSTWFLMVI